MIKSAVVLLLAACVTALMRRQSAAIRHSVWTAGLIGAMAIPLCTLTLPSWETTLASPTVTWMQEMLSVARPVRDIALGVWVAGAAIGLVMLLYSAGRLAWVAVRSEPVEDRRWSRLAEEVRAHLGIRRSVRLLQNRSVPFLGTWGILVPRVLLPSDAESWPDNRIRMVLAHELAHIQRHDWVVQVLADAARAIYWFNPIFWLASSRLRRESEYACDDAVVRMGATGADYAEELLAMTRALRMEQRLQSPILAMAQPSHLEQRLVALLNPSLNRLAATPWAVIVVTAVAVALTLPLAAFRPDSIPPEATTLGAAVFPPSSESDGMPQNVPVGSADSFLAQSALNTETVTQQTKPLAVPAHPTNGLVEESRPDPEDQIANLGRQPFETGLLPAVPNSGPATARTQAVSAPDFADPDPVQAIALTATNAASTVPFDCKVTPSTFRTKTATIEKFALGNGPWLINKDMTIWATDQPYVANSVVNTIWMRPANTELSITAQRLDGDAPALHVGPAAPLATGYIGVGVAFPAAGCWEVTATAGTSTLTFITKVRE